jgi:hypothetical protein
MLALVVEVPLLALNIRQHLAHEVRLIDLGEPWPMRSAQWSRRNGTDTATAASSWLARRSRPGI